MTLKPIIDWHKHALFMRELRERCAAECLNLEVPFNAKGDDIVRRIEAKMLEEGWDPGLAQ